MSKLSRATWQAEAAIVIRKVARAQDTFTSDDLWATGLSRPHEPRALGAAMAAVRRAGWIEPTGEWRVSVRAICHRRRLWVWRSLLRTSRVNTQ